ncbi:MAG: phage tail sheath subtilisin-like domain-containing protein [Solirubrobacterales bacterium]
MTATFVAPDNPGVDVRFTGEKTLSPGAAAAATIGIPFTSDWGPFGPDEGTIRMNSFGEYDANFGNSKTGGRRAVLGAFVGSGAAGNPGAGAVIGYRMGAATAAKSKLVVKNTKEAPENALELLGFYKGARGNRISAVIEADPANSATKDRLRVLFDGLTVEKYSYLKTDVAALAAAVNKRSQYVSAVSLKTGLALAHTAGTSLAGGANGDTLTAEEWLEALAAFEYEPISVFAPFDLSDEAIQVSVVAWEQTQADQMKPISVVLGGALGEDLDEAITRTEAYEDEHVVSLGAGTFHDELIGEDLSTAQLVPRVAGALAGLGEEKSLTNLPFVGLSLVGEPAVPTDQLAVAAEAGITVFRRTSSEQAELKVSKGVTAYTADTDEKPRDIWGDPRQIRVMDLFIREIVEWGETYIVGPTRVTESTMKAVKAKGEGMINERRDRGLILPGATDSERPYFNVLEPASVGAPEDSIPFEFGWKFARTTNYMIGRGKVL